MISTGDNKAPAEEESYEVIEYSKEEEEVHQSVVSRMDLHDLEFEVLSNIDPEDEFLQSERSFSLIEGVSDMSCDFTVLSNKTSEFSILSGS